jgi:Protein of unknown function (DUF3298)/Deacetylase PdaC
MKKCFFLLSVLSFLLFYACKNEKTSTSSISTTPPSVSAAPKGFYKHFKGTVSTFPVTMDLVLAINETSDYLPSNFRGHYYYDKYQEPIGLYGEIDSTGNIVLHETNWQEKELYFKGKMDANGSFSGIWQDEKSKKNLPFSLKESYEDGAMSFDFHSFEDSLKLWQNVPKSPLASFDMQLLLPSKNTEGGLSIFLKDKIFKGIKNDSLENSYVNMSVENLKNALRDSFFTSYRETLIDEKPDSLGEGAATFNFAESSSMSILFNEKDWLSVGYGTYSYGGGAHGNHATNLATYDLAQKKALALNDVFLPKYEKTLSTALVSAVRRQFNIPKNEPLTTALFENKIEPTTNFCITKKGILFLYNPYEIAAYAMGEIELFIPFDEVKSIVNPRFSP